MIIGSMQGGATVADDLTGGPMSAAADPSSLSFLPRTSCAAPQ